MTQWVPGQGRLVETMTVIDWLRCHVEEDLLWGLTDRRSFCLKSHQTEGCICTLEERLLTGTHGDKGEEDVLHNYPVTGVIMSINSVCSRRPQLMLCFYKSKQKLAF